MRELQDQLARLDRLGVLSEVQSVGWSRDMLTRMITVSTCEAFAAICADSRVEAPAGSWSVRASYRFYDVNIDGYTLEHKCWEHLDCWGTKP